MTNIYFILLLSFICFLLYARIIKNLKFGFNVFLSLYFIGTLFFPASHGDPLLTFLGFSIYFFDVFAVLFFSAGVYRIAKINVFKSTDIPFLIYLCAEFFFITISYFVFAKAAIVDARGAIYWLGPILYFASFNYKDLDFSHFFKIFYFYSVSLIILAISRWSGLIPIPVYYQIENAAYSNFRVLYAQQGLDLVLFSSVLALLIIKKEIKLTPHIFIIITSILVIIFIQQRTVWLVLIIIWLLYLYKFKIKYPFAIILLSVLFFYLIYLIVGYFKTTEFAFDYSLINLINDPGNSTGMARIAQAITVFDLVNSSNILFGHLYGSSVNKATLLNGQWFDFGIHMYHVSKLLYGGLILLMTYLFFHVFLFIKMLIVSKKNGFTKYYYTHWFITFSILVSFIFAFSTDLPTISSFIYGISLILIRKKIIY